MDRALQYIIGKLEHANLVLGDRTNVKSVGAHSQQKKNKGETTYVHFVQAIIKL